MTDHVETLEEFVERRRCAHLSYDETERELFDALKKNKRLNRTEDLARRLAAYIESLKGRMIPNPAFACLLVFEARETGVAVEGGLMTTCPVCGSWHDAGVECGRCKAQGESMNNHVKTLERWINDSREGEEYRISIAARAVLKENKQLQKNLSMWQQCSATQDHELDAEGQRGDRLETRIDAALALKMPQLTHEDDDEHAVYEHGWDDCMGATVKALRRDQPEEVKP